MLKSCWCFWKIKLWNTTSDESLWEGSRVSFQKEGESRSTFRKLKSQTLSADSILEMWVKCEVKRLIRNERWRNTTSKYEEKKSVYPFQSFGSDLLALVGLPLFFFFFKSIHSNLLNTSVCFKKWKHIKAKYKHISGSFVLLYKDCS